jgi:GntR family transcriptional regulator
MLENDKIDRRSIIPLYYQLASILRSQIQATVDSGGNKSGNLLPSERELMHLYNVSRNTVRKAIQKLTQEGVIYSEHGEGNYIVSANFAIQCRMDIFVEHSELLTRAGFTPKCRLIDSTDVIPDELVCEKLSIDQTSSVRRTRKVFFADDRPAVYAVDFVSLPEHLDLSQINDDGQAFFPYLEDQRELRVEFLLSDMYPILADGEVAEYLSIDIGTPLIMMHDVFLDPSKNKPIAFAKNYYRTDVLHFSILRRRD